MNTNRSDPVTTIRLRPLLFELARRQDDLAADELTATPYWSTRPASVRGHRAAAAALCAEADLLLAAN